MSSNLNEKVKYREISKSELQEISKKFHVSLEILNDILGEWVYYLFEMEDHNQNPNPFEPNDSSARTKDWAQLSLFFHTYKSILTSENPELIREVIINFKDPTAEPIKLSTYFSNQLITSYFKSLTRTGYVLDKRMAEEIINEKPKTGRRPTNITLIQNYLIHIAYTRLKATNVGSYSPLIKKLLATIVNLHLSEEGVRQAINRQ